MDVTGIDNGMTSGMTSELTQTPWGLEGEPVGMEVEVATDEPGSPLDPATPQPSGFYDNLAALMEEDELEDLASLVLEGFESDKQDRSEYDSRIKDGIQQVFGRGEGVGEGLCDAKHPLILENAVKFQSKASQEMFPTTDWVKVKGNNDRQVEWQAAANVIVQELMPELFGETERALLYAPIVGSAFKKVYWDAAEDRAVCEFVKYDDIYVAVNETSLARTKRISHVVWRNHVDYRADVESGLYLDADIGDGETREDNEIEKQAGEVVGLTVTKEDGHSIIEQHVHCVLPERFCVDGCMADLAYPYVVSVDKSSRKVLAVRRNWEEGNAGHKRIECFVHYCFVPGMTFYGLGFVHMLGDTNRTLTTAIRALVDGGQFASMPAGLKSKHMKIVGDNEPFRPGEFKDVEANAQDIDKSIYPLPFKEPSQVLQGMVSYLDDRGQRFADAGEAVVDGATNYGPVGTTLALLEASTKFYGAVYKRMVKAFGEELRIIQRLYGKYKHDGMIGQGIKWVPAADPNAMSGTHKMALAQILFEVAKQAPQYHDMKEVIKRLYMSMGVEDVVKILPEAQEATEQDPVSDIMLAVQGKPIRAFDGQNHDAHIAIKGMWLEDPMNGGNPAMSVARPALEANMQEHMMRKYMEQVRGIMTSQGVPQDAAASDKAMQDAAAQILAFNKAQGGQEQPGADMVLAMAEMKKADAMTKREETDAIEKAANIALENRKLGLQEAKIVGNQETADKKLALETAKALADAGIKAEKMADERVNSNGQA